MRNLVIVLGDQLNHGSAAFQGFDPSGDIVWMAEVEEEATCVWAHKLRIAFFFSAMRHFREELQKKGIPVRYHELKPDAAQDRGKTFSEVLRESVQELQPEKLVVVTPGDYRVLHSLKEAAQRLSLELEIRPDTHFYCDIEEFKEYAQPKRRLLLEQFYRQMRKRHRILLDTGGAAGGKWNFDAENRRSLKAGIAEPIPQPLGFLPDRLTAEVISTVNTRFRDHPGSLDSFNLPVTQDQAGDALDDFVAKRLRNFGPFEDAMLTGQPFLFHSRLSSSLNTKLLDPRECIEAAVQAFEKGNAPINSVEGFVRQILGWREYVRGVYWANMPDYADMNYLDHHCDVPSFFWDGATDMECVRQTMSHIIEFAYSHHIHRLMVIGNLAILLGVHPRKFHDWHMAMYVDAVDWASLPNTLGMSQHGDGGIMGSKPYFSTGRYIDRMSDFCARCPYEPGQSLGHAACPFTTLYWDFLDRHYGELKKNPRLALQLRNLQSRDTRPRMGEVKQRSDALRRDWCAL